MNQTKLPSVVIADRGKQRIVKGTTVAAGTASTIVADEN